LVCNAGGKVATQDEEERPRGARKRNLRVKKLFSIKTLIPSISKDGCNRGGVKRAWGGLHLDKHLGARMSPIEDITSS